MGNHSFRRLFGANEQGAKSATLPQGESHFEAVITDIPIQKGKTWRCDIRIMRLNNHLLRHPLLLKASILNSPQHDMHLTIGQGLVADAMLEPLRDTPQQLHFNYALWLKRQGYVGETFIPYWQLRTQKLPLSLPFWQRLQLKLHCIRAKMLCYLHGLAPNTMENTLITALILGEKRALPRALKDDFNMAGASHILHSQDFISALSLACSHAFFAGAPSRSPSLSSHCGHLPSS